MMVKLVPAAEAGQLPCVDPSTVKAGHSVGAGIWKENNSVSSHQLKIAINVPFGNIQEPTDKSKQPI